jgi:hypothetical protein
MPIDVYAQPVFTIAPQAVGGISCWAPTSPPMTPLFGTPLFSGVARAEGSLWGITGDSNLAFTFGIGYDSRGTSGQGATIWGNSNYDLRQDYIETDLSIRYQWLQAGVEYGIPLNGYLDFPNATVPVFTNLSKGDSNADMGTTIGIFAAANYPLAQWSTGKLNLTVRIDYDLYTNSNTTILVRNQAPNPIISAPRYAYSTGSTGPIFLARLGLSYDFNVWEAKK